MLTVHPHLQTGHFLARETPAIWHLARPFGLAHTQGRLRLTGDASVRVSEAPQGRAAALTQY